MKRAMNRGSLALVAAVALSGAILAPAAAGAQSVPGAIAKRSAQNAVAATNAHTEAMTNTSSTPTTLPGQSGAATQARPAGTPTPGTKARGTPAAVAGNGTTPAEKPAPATAAPTAKGAAPRYAATAGKGQGAASVSVSESGAATQLTFSRETFEYAGRGRRDPFLSLMKSGDLRPLYQDLKLVTVLYDPTGRNSVAIMRDLSTKDQYRVKVGQTLGRMRVSQIQPKQVVFALEEFGYSRQEVLALNDSTKARKQ